MIFINKQLLASNGVTVNHHKVEVVELATNGLGLIVKGSAWVSSLERAQGQPPVERWSTRVDLQELDLSPGLIPAITNHLTAAGLLEGGEVVPGDDQTLEDRKALKHSLIKYTRSEIIASDLATAYGTFQCRGQHRTDMTDAVALAQTLTGLGAPVSIAYTLADNSVVTLDATQMVNVGLTFASRVQSSHARARALRALVDAAQTVEEVDLIHWDMTLPE